MEHVALNYYERHLGDYARDTGHLSLLEHGVYTLLLDRYYASEQGIPEGQVYRVARARSEEERAAVDAVLNEFFQLTEGLWVQGRAEEEIERYRRRQVDREEVRESEAERKRRYRERRAKLYEQLRARGVVPDFNTPTDEIVRMLSHGTGRGLDAGQD